MPLQRIITAFRKLLFCYQVSRTFSAFASLMVNTKKFAWWKKTHTTRPPDPPVVYALQLHHEPRNVSLRTYAGDLAIFYAVWWNKVYQLPDGVTQAARTIIDLGAHVGMTSLYFSSLAPEAAVYAVEADQHNFALLQKNLGPYPQVIPIYAAINDKEEMVYLQTAAFSYNTRISDTVTSTALQGITMHRLIEQYHITRIDVLKIDIEGAEQLLFKGNVEWLQHTSHILIELHEPFNAEALSVVLSPYGFVIEAKHYDHEHIYHAYKR